MGWSNEALMWSWWAPVIASNKSTWRGVISRNRRVTNAISNARSMMLMISSGSLPKCRQCARNKETDITSRDSNVCIVHQPQIKVNLIKYLEHQKFGFDYTFDAEDENRKVNYFKNQLKYLNKLLRCTKSPRGPWSMPFATGQWQRVSRMARRAVAKRIRLAVNSGKLN